jgi:hypothetical protein
MNLTIDNWKSEYNPLQICYKRLSDPQSLEARSVNDHMAAVRQKIIEPAGAGKAINILQE